MSQVGARGSTTL